MKIVVVSFTFHPEVDGVAIAAGLMVTNFVSAGHEVHVVTGLSRSRITDEAVCAYTTHRFGVIEDGEVNHAGETAYVDFLKKPEHDVVIFHCWRSWPTDIALKHIGEIMAKKVILSHGYDTHIFYLQNRFPWGLGFWLRRLPRAVALPADLKAFDRVVLLSSKTDFGRFFDGLVARFIGCKHIRIIPNSVNADFKPDSNNFRDKLELGTGPLFLCVANYSTRKNQQMALEAYCRANVPNSSMVFAGSELGDYGRNVQQMWEASKSQHPHLRVHFLEGLSRGDIVSAFRSCDVFVLSATAETQPIAILEAMACAKPFISTDTGCVSELEGGIVIKGVDDMAEQMRTLAENPNMRDQLGQRGKSYFEKYCAPDATRKAWLDLIEEVVHGEKADS